MVVIDRGEADNVQVGDVLRVLHRGPTIKDSVSPDPRDTVTLPDESAGILMIFRTFERVSFGIIMHANRAMHVMDKVTSTM